MATGAGGWFSITEALRFGWGKTKANLKPLLIIGLVGAFLSLLNQALTRPQNVGGAGPLLALVMQVLQVGVTLAYVRAALALHDGQRVDLNRPAELLTGFVGFLLVSILYGLIVAGGLLLLVVPGVIWGIQFGFAGFAVADRKLPVLQALRESSALTRGVKWPLLGFGLALFGLNLLGAIALGVGLLLTLPVSAIAAAYVYRRLQERARAAPQPVPPPPRPMIIAPPAPATSS
jgi:hypothetical protein